MKTLSELKTSLSDRLAEFSTVFWSDQERTNLLNEAQLFVAKLAGGIPRRYTTDSTIFTMPDYWIGSFESSGHVRRADGRSHAVRFISAGQLDRVFPDWRSPTFKLNPMWVVLDRESRQAQVVPALPADATLELTFGALPPDLRNGSDLLFDGQAALSIYESPVVTLAAGFALLKERYENDAERFFTLAMQNLTALGIDPYSIPLWEAVKADVGRSEPA